jgi:two-component system, OmpR family, sensor histidine kinase CiaH
MFHSARIKLTAWYLLIIMVISISFSLFVFRETMTEVRRGLRLHTLRLNQGFELEDQYGSTFSIIAPKPELPLAVDVAIYNEIEHRILTQLIIVNMGIFAVSGLAGYFLAGKTLHPIELMVDTQKQFVADASHELRTPLTAMKTEIEVALRDKQLEMNDAKSLLKSNLEEIDHMQTLSNYLLSLSRYQNTSQINLMLEPIQIENSIGKAIDRVAHQAKMRHITIEPSIQNAAINGNTVSITELITILLDNAIKYSHENGKVLVSSTVSNKTVLVSVEDFGVGIKKTEIPFIFNRFYRADSSRNKTKTDGYGLGLSIAKQIVVLHNGSIDVDSTPNKGTTFRVSFPVVTV